MEVFYHGSNTLFEHFDLSHALEGNGKIKFGYGVYVTSHYDSAAHYASVNKEATDFYVYTLEVPELKEGNYIAFKQCVHPEIIRHAEEKLGFKIPEKEQQDGKFFRKFLAKRLTGKTSTEDVKIRYGIGFNLCDVSCRHFFKVVLIGKTRVFVLITGKDTLCSNGLQSQAESSNPAE